MPAAKKVPLVLSLESAGMLMTLEEFENVDDWDECYRYELIHGVLVVREWPPPEIAGPNEILGYQLWKYKEEHPNGAALDYSLSQQFIFTATSRRIADTLIWTGLNRYPNTRHDVPTIAVEFVTEGRRHRRRDHLDKKREYGEVGIKEYWIIDRFQRRMTVVQYKERGTKERIIDATEIYETPFLPGFQLPLARILEMADEWARAQSQ